MILVIKRPPATKAAGGLFFYNLTKMQRIFENNHTFYSEFCDNNNTFYNDKMFLRIISLFLHEKRYFH